MSSHGPSPSVSPPSIDPKLWARLEKLADAAGCGAGDLVVDVLRDFADEQERHLAAIDAGIAEADAGELVDYDEVKADIGRKLADLFGSAVTLRISFTRLAKRDLDELIVFIGERNPQAAVEVAARIFGRIDLLRDQPALGRPGRRSGTRQLVVGGTLYLVAYRIEASRREIRILRILHSSRRWPRKL